MSRVEAPHATRHVLIIDDDRGLQTLFSTLLDYKGFSIDIALDGWQAYHQIRRNAYNVILLDLMMPKVNGLELIRRLARDSPWLLSRIIVISGASRAMLDELDTQKLWGVMRKPFDLDELTAAITACAEGQLERAPSRRATDATSPLRPS